MFGMTQFSQIKDSNFLLKFHKISILSLKLCVFYISFHCSNIIQSWGQVKAIVSCRTCLCWPAPIYGHRQIAWELHQPASRRRASLRQNLEEVGGVSLKSYFFHQVEKQSRSKISRSTVFWLLKGVTDYLGITWLFCKPSIINIKFCISEKKN